MHFNWVCWVMDLQEVYSLIWPYQEWENDCISFRDWFEIWWKRAWLIKLKKNHEYSLPKYITKKLHTSVARKKDIEYFYEWETDKDLYPQTRMFFDKNWDPVFQPKEFERDQINKKRVERKDLKGDLKRYYEKLEAWYDSVPDDYYIVIIDYHI